MSLYLQGPLQPSNAKRLWTIRTLPHRFKSGKQWRQSKVILPIHFFLREPKIDAFSIPTSLEAYVKRVKIVKFILPTISLGRRRGHYESREGSGDGESYGVWAVNQSKQPWRESFYNRVEAAEEVHATGQYQVPSTDEGLTIFTTQIQ